MVGGNPGPAIYRPPFDQLVYGVILEARDEKDALFAQKPEPRVVDIALVEGHDGAFGQGKAFCHAAFVGFGLAYVRKDWDVAVVVEHGVHLDTGLVFAKCHPWEQQQAQADDGRVDAVSLHLKRNLCYGVF